MKLWEDIKNAKVKSALAILGTAGFVLGVVVAFRSDSANALLGVSVILLIVAYLGERLEKFTLKHGDTEFSGDVRAAILQAKQATKVAGGAVESALTSLELEATDSSQASTQDVRRAALASSLAQLRSATYLYPRTDAWVSLWKTQVSS
ncbi:hypothetical protein BJF84_17145 [Rhodococcus sp. CUA-806]|nr:hypothetical protein BJF84_17145 [Rhodococcus sp. CUA-806]